jgi:N-acetylglucosaminyldiphosphoundecaprenol N-acetyl-beta-D-mannosaminyltransferase
MKLTPMTSNEMIHSLASSINTKQQCIIAYQNLHGMHLSYMNADINRLHALDKTYVYIDGFPIYLICRLLGRRVRRNQRITGNDYVWDLLRIAERRDWRLYFVGSTEEVVAAASVTIRRRVPDLAFRAHHGYFKPAENDAILADIDDFTPDLIVTCMGMPLQEKWIAANADRLTPASICAMGAILEYISGFARTPPRWLGPLGLEWLFRLVDDPERFWHRYLAEPWILLGNLVRYGARRP